MRVIGCLCWADEDPVWLMAAVTALAPLLDHLVAVDGKYVLFPGALTDPSSSVEQACAVLEACAAARIGVTLHRPEAPFEGNEVEKRQFSVGLAGLVKASDDDWVIVFDADTVARRFDPDFVRADLEGSDHLVASYGLYNDPSDEGFTPIRGIYRLAAGLAYGPAHYCVSVGASDGSRVWLWGNPEYQAVLADPLDLTQALKFDHRSQRRPRARVEKARSYYERRDSLGVERLADTFVQTVDGEWANVRDRNWSSPTAP